MMSPLAALKPARRALPLPTPSCSITLSPARSDFATTAVPSLERPSTRITSSTQCGIRGSTKGRLGASFSAGTTTLTRGVAMAPAVLASASGIDPGSSPGIPTR